MINAHTLPQRRGPEILAPAGTMEAFWAALGAGADAVYVGLKAFNAREAARNFTLSEITELTRLAHREGRRLFVALNVLIKEREILELVDILAALEAIAPDALIIQDLGLWHIARRYFPGLRLHASTLMTVHNSLGVRQARDMGFSRVVLAREMTLEEIAAAVRAAPVEVEVFCHGALCFSYSGLCLFSSLFGGKASTRGRCVQPCRRRYSWNGKQGTFFSLNDLCALDVLPRLRDIGVHSLKIEGRLRPAHYVASVVRAYRRVLDAPAGDTDALVEARGLVAQALGRPLTTAYFLSPHPSEAVSPTRSANTGAYLGRIVRREADRLLVRTVGEVGTGDRLRLVDRKRDEQISFVCRGTKPSGGEGGLWILGAPSGPKAFGPGSLLFRADVARSPLLAGSAGGRPHREARGDIARSHPGDQRRIGHLAAARARQVRQALLHEMQQGAGRSPHRDEVSRPTGHSRRRGAQQPPLWVKIRHGTHLALAETLRAQGVFVEIGRQTLRTFAARGPRPQRGLPLVWTLPPIITEDHLPFFQKAVRQLRRQGYHRFQIGNLGELQLFGAAAGRKAGPDRQPVQLYGAYTLNLLNPVALKAVRDLGLSEAEFSVETDLKNLGQALSTPQPLPTSVVVFGYLPLFTSRMDHPLYDERRPVVSTRGERFHWQRHNGIGFLLPDRPLSLLGAQGTIDRLPLSSRVIDLSWWPRAVPMPRRFPTDNRGLARVLSGSTMNFLSELK